MIERHRRSRGAALAAVAALSGAAALSRPPASAADIRSAATTDCPNGEGYVLATAGGRAIPFGEVEFRGSTPSPLASPVVGIATTPSGDGYWQAAADGGVFNFGDAPFCGSSGGTGTANPVVGISPSVVGIGRF